MWMPSGFSLGNAQVDDESFGTSDLQARQDVNNSSGRRLSCCLESVRAFFHGGKIPLLIYLGRTRAMSNAGHLLPVARYGDLDAEVEIACSITD